MPLARTASLPAVWVSNLESVHAVRTPRSERMQEGPEASRTGVQSAGREGARAESWRCLLSMPSHLRFGPAGPHRESWRRKTRPDHHEPWKPLGAIWVWTWAYGLWRHQSTRGTGSQTCFSERSFGKLRKGLTGMSRAQNRQTWQKWQDLVVGEKKEMHGLEEEPV